MHSIMLTSAFIFPFTFHRDSKARSNLFWLQTSQRQGWRDTAKSRFRMTGSTEHTPLVPTPSESDSNGTGFSISAAIAAHGGTYPPNSHSHYVSNQKKIPYFEGWFLRAVLPNGDSFAFIYAIESLGKGCVQVIDPSDTLHIGQLDSNSVFHASKKRWELSHWGHRPPYLPKPSNYPALETNQPVLQGWQVDYFGTHGSMYTESTNVQWKLDYQPTLGWGTRGTGRHTGTWLASFPVFEPGYQVLMAHGYVSDGWVKIGDSMFDLKGSTVYAEKNWGRGFPPKWFWMQANTFQSELDLCVVALGARRTVIVAKETVGLIGIHYNGQLFEFANWSSTQMNWRTTWGDWFIEAKSRNGFSATVSGHCKDDGMQILGPTDTGMAYTMRDTTQGTLHVRLCDPQGNVVVDDQCDTAQLEIGGDDWDIPWEASVNAMSQPLRGVVNRFNQPSVMTD